eukprot:15460220-Alexandrium_andersonii.AAC.1
MGTNAACSFMRLPKGLPPPGPPVPPQPELQNWHLRRAPKAPIGGFARAGLGGRNKRPWASARNCGKRWCPSVAPHVALAPM